MKILTRFQRSFFRVDEGEEIVHPLNEFYTEATIILRQILCYIFDAEYSPDFRVEDIQDEPITSRQSLFKNMGYFELLTDIIYFPIYHGYHKFEDLRPGMYITSVLKESYNCIRYISQEYRPNELYASQWLQLVIEQALETGDLNDINASATLTELMDNNKTVLETRIDADLIKKFINYLIEKEKDAQYLNI